MEREFNPELDTFEQFKIPCGRDSISIRFAHLSLTFQTVDRATKDLIGAMYETFVLDDPRSSPMPDPSGMVFPRPEPNRGGAKILTVRSDRKWFVKLVPGEIYRIEFLKKDRTLYFWSYYFACRYDPEKGEGILALCEGEEVNQRQVIENFMRVILSYIALNRRSFFLHSSGIVKDGKAHIFFGHSGAGKTTIVTIAKDLPLLSDDQVLVYLKEGKPFASGVPFSGGERFRKEAEAIQQGNVNAEFEIAGLYWLVQDSKTYLEPLPLIQAAAKLASAIPFIKDSPFPMQEALDLAAEIARRSKIYALHFRKDDSFLQVI